MPPSPRASRSEYSRTDNSLTTARSPSPEPRSPVRTRRRGSNPRSAARRGGHSPESRRGPNRSLGFSDVDGEDLIYTSSDEDERLEMQHSRAAENPEDLATAEEFWSSLVILSFMVLIYLWGAVELCRKHIWLEALFTIVLPVFAMTTGWQEYTAPYQKKLIIVDTVFNGISIFARIAIATELSTLNAVTSYGFFAFLLLQFAYYTAFCIKQGLEDEDTLWKARKGLHWFTAAMTASMFLTIVCQRAEAGDWLVAASTLGPEGELLIWGTDAGVMVKINYTLFQAYVLFCDDFQAKIETQGIEGYMMVPVAQFCSVVLAWWSGEFWHARMITGVHLVLMDGIHHTHNARHRAAGATKNHGSFCVMPAHWYKKWTDLELWEKKARFPELDERSLRRLHARDEEDGLEDFVDVPKPCYMYWVVPWLRWFLLVFCVLAPATSVACSTHEFYCGMHIETVRTHPPLLLEPLSSELTELPSCVSRAACRLLKTAQCVIQKADCFGSVAASIVRDHSFPEATLPGSRQLCVPSGNPATLYCAT